MELWIVEGIWHYESSDVIGVYTSKKRAKSAAGRRALKYDTYIIRKLEVNADYEYGDKIRSGR